MKKVDSLLPFSSILCFLQVQNSKPYRMHLQSIQVVGKQARRLYSSADAKTVACHVVCCFYLVSEAFSVKSIRSKEGRSDRTKQNIA
jgi:hypothetical protein